MKKIGFLFVCLIIFLYPAINVNAESNGYIVKMVEGFYPDTDLYNLREINKEIGLYQTDDLESLNPIKEHILRISENSKVSLINPIEPVRTFSLPNDELYNEQWQTKLINAEAGWNLEAYGNDIIVGVIDSGCYSHDDLVDNLLPGKNYFTGTNIVNDNIGHGTHVSGIIAAAMNDFGVVGVAPKAKIVPLKCFDSYYNTYVEDILDAIRDAVNVYNCDVINMSWGILDSSEDKSAFPDLKDAIDYAYDKGVILIAAVGNDGASSLYYPAAYDNVIGVGSVDAEKDKSSFSQYNESVMITASGENVKSTYKNGNYEFKSGTSQAAPMISGIAAVALSVDNTLTNDEFKSLLCETAEDLGSSGYDVRFGYGLANESALMEKLMQRMDYYVSPVNVQADEAYVLVKNNTNSQLKAMGLFSTFENNRLTSLVKTDVELLGGKQMLVKTGDEGNKFVHLLWKDLNYQKPIAVKRELEK